MNRTTTEAARLAALASHDILDTAPEGTFDELVQLASEICETPIALVSFVDADRQWFKASVGLAVRETPREVAFCARAIEQDSLFVVPDAHVDPRFAANPLVVGDPNVRFYAGIPLTSTSGHKLGTLCVIDRRPRELTAAQTRALAVLGRQVEAQLALRASRDRAQGDADRWFELSADPKAVVGPHGHYVRVNAAFAALVELPAAEIIGKHAFEFVYSDDQEATMQALAPLWTSDAGVARFKNRHRSSSGGLRRLAWACVKVDGRVYASGRDFTDEHELQARLVQVDKMEAIGRLAGGIAHDFNNLLAIIQGFTRFASDELPPDGAIAADLATALGAAERATALTRQLLLFSRTGATSEPRRVELGAALAGIAKMLRHLIGSDIDLSTAVAPGAWPVRIDPGQLEQVIVNLVVNARDAMPHGGTLRIEADNVPGEDRVAIRVIDSGIGMDDATRAHMFEPFFTTKELGKGTGLGLATVYAIVSDAGGALSCASEPGRGTTFTVALPRDRSLDDTVPVARIAPDMRGHQRVLLVEDEPAMREFTRRALVRLGYEVVEAESSPDALARFSAAPSAFDAVVTDIIMPTLRGTVLVERMRVLRPALAVLLVSGYPGQEIAVDSTTAFLEKPLTVRALGEKLHGLLAA